jgi:hypothetical protein
LILRDGPAGTIVKEVESAETLDRCTHGALDRRFVGHVRLDEQRGPARVPDQALRRLAGLSGQLGNGDLRAFLSESHRCGASDLRSRSCDQGNLVRESLHRSPSVASLQ